MHLDAALPYDLQLRNVPAAARAAEQHGFNAIWSAETQHDPFLPGPLIAEHSKNILFGTAIAVSFARNPATLAYTAWDLARASNGRFVLGLGTQIKAHITRRFGMSWPDSPVGLLREQLHAIRAFWNTWQTGERLNFRGDYYKLSLMSPFFNPGPIEYPGIPIFIAGVNTGMATLAGEAADGFHVHPLHSPQYLESVIHTAIKKGAAKTGRTPAHCAVSTTVFAATNESEREFVRQQISFYASTPSYRPVLSLHGWDAAGETLSRMAARKQWDDMPALINDKMLETFAVIAPAEKLAASLQARYLGLSDRITLYLPFNPGERDQFWQKLTATFNK
jgi:probable F420-dependent oxidoreductase